MGKLRCNLDKSKRDLDMQSWVEKNKPLQSVSITAKSIDEELTRNDLDEVAHDLTLDNL